MAVARDRSRTFKANVTAGTNSWDDVVIPSGETWRVTKCFGAATYQGDTGVEIVWDRSGTPEVIFGTYGTYHLDMVKEFIGDGIKKLSIKLGNGSASNTFLMGRYAAEILL